MIACKPNCPEVVLPFHQAMLKCYYTAMTGNGIICDTFPACKMNVKAQPLLLWESMCSI